MFTCDSPNLSLKLTALVIYTNANNRASRRVAEKIGAVLVKIKPEEDESYCAVYDLKPEDLRLEQ
jgi:RimJ/RimL family protein N-acetyltransferase